MSAFYVWINGQLAGYSEGSMEPSEFNITSCLNAGTNQIAVEVYRYSDGSYLEDQDFWALRRNSPEYICDTYSRYPHS